MAAGFSRIFGIHNFRNVPLINGHAPIVSKEISFVETGGAATYTGSVVVPAGATLLDIRIRSTALWDNAGAVTMKVGEADDDGWFIGINLKATDLLVGEEINFDNTGGKEGAYLVTATGLRSAAYSATARTISGIITTASTGGSAGRTRMLVIYAPKPDGSVTVATKA